MATTCAPATPQTLFGTYGLYDDSKPGCDNAAALLLGKPVFYGKNNANRQPLFVVLDYEHFKIARSGMVVASGAALVLGVTALVLAIKLAKKD